MPVLPVLIGEGRACAGTSQIDQSGYGADGPTQATMVARPGQQVVELAIDEDVGSLDPDALHARIEKVHLKGRVGKKAT